MKKYIEIARFSNNWPDMGEYEDIDRMVGRGQLRKAVRYMTEWDFGVESVDAARSRGTVRDTPLDKASINDKVLYTQDKYTLCAAHCKSGLYDAYYLVREVTPEELGEDEDDA